MAIFNSYVSLPKGTPEIAVGVDYCCGRWMAGCCSAGVAQVMEVPWACLLLPETCRYLCSADLPTLKLIGDITATPQKTGK
jgi:hypothetical protein